MVVRVLRPDGRWWAHRTKADILDDYKRKPDESPAASAASEPAASSSSAMCPPANGLQGQGCDKVDDPVLVFGQVDSFGLRCLKQSGDSMGVGSPNAPEDRSHAALPTAPIMSQERVSKIKNRLRTHHLTPLLTIRRAGGQSI